MAVKTPSKRITIASFYCWSHLTDTRLLAALYPYRHAELMKAVIFILVVFAAGCDESQATLKVVAVQHIGKGIMNGDACKTLYREDGGDVISPFNFGITPFEAVAIAKDKLGYACGNKLGAQILADKKHYYIVRLGDTQDAIVLNGMDGSIVSKGFMDRSK